MSRKNIIILLLTLFLFAVLVRGIVWYFEPELSRDSIYYLALVDGKDVGGFRPPLFVEIMRWIKALGGDPHIGGVIVNILAGALIPVVVFFIARELKFEFRWQAASAVFAAVHPGLVTYSVELLRESLYLFFISLLIYAVVSAVVRKNLWLWAAAGACGALAALCRFEALEFLPLTGGVIVCHWFFLKKEYVYKVLTPCVFGVSWGMAFFLVAWCCGMPLEIFWKAAVAYGARF